MSSLKKKKKEKHKRGWDDAPQQRSLIMFSFTLAPCFLHAVPDAFPKNIQVKVLNSTVAEVSWDPVPAKSLRGHLKGFKVRRETPTKV